jgi:hypothetical protein
MGAADAGSAMKANASATAGTDTNLRITAPFRGRHGPVASNNFCLVALLREFSRATVYVVD